MKKTFATNPFKTAALRNYKQEADLASVTSVYLGSLSIFSKQLFYRTTGWEYTGTPVDTYISTEETLG